MWPCTSLRVGISDKGLGMGLRGRAPVFVTEPSLWTEPHISAWKCPVGTFVGWETGYGLGMGLWTTGPPLDICYWIFLEAFSSSLFIFLLAHSSVLQFAFTPPTCLFYGYVYPRWLGVPNLAVNDLDINSLLNDPTFEFACDKWCFQR